MFLKKKIAFLLCLLMVGTSSLPFSCNQASAQDSVELYVSSKIKKTILKNAEHYKGFYLKKEKFLPLHSNVSILIKFTSTNGIETQSMKGISSIDEAKAYIDKYLKVHETMDNIDIRELPLFYLGQDTVLFWVGDKPFSSLEEAKTFIRDQIVLINEVIQEETKKATPTETVEEEVAAPTRIERVGNKVINTLKNTAVGFPKPIGEIEYMSFGSTTYTENGFSERGLNSVGLWWEHKYLMKGYEIPKGGPRLDFYLKLLPELSSRSIPWENRITYGVGCEYIPFVKWKANENRLAFSWINSLRLYAEFLNMALLKEDYDGSNYDRKLGIGLYKEYNILENNQMPKNWRQYFWGTVWGDWAYKTTSFSSANYKTLSSGVDIRFGTYIFKSSGLNLMPYIFINKSLSENSFYWENTLHVGPGFRIMPFRHERFKNFQWLYNLSFFVRYYENVKYFKDDPEAGTPTSDLRVGIGYSHNWYY